MPERSSDSIGPPRIRGRSYSPCTRGCGSWGLRPSVVRCGFRDGPDLDQTLGGVREGNGFVHQGHHGDAQRLHRHRAHLHNPQHAARLAVPLARAPRAEGRSGSHVPTEDPGVHRDAPGVRLRHHRAGRPKYRHTRREDEQLALAHRVRGSAGPIPTEVTVVR